jgi:Acyltransferase family
MASSTATNGLATHIAPPLALIGFRLGQRPALDGVRAFAVLVVMAHHGYVPFFRGGSIGVDIFFVLSGFLITCLLLEEWEKTSGITFRRFYGSCWCSRFPWLGDDQLTLKAWASCCGRLHGSGGVDQGRHPQASGFAVAA